MVILKFKQQSFLEDSFDPHGRSRINGLHFYVLIIHLLHYPKFQSTDDSDYSLPCDDGDFHIRGPSHQTLSFSSHNDASSTMPDVRLFSHTVICHCPLPTAHNDASTTMRSYCCSYSNLIHCIHMSPSRPTPYCLQY